MPNIAKVLKEGISRISRHEAKVTFTPLQRRTIRLERAAADLKRRTSLLEKENKQLQARLAQAEAAQPEPPAPEPANREWISGKGVKALRQRLGLTQHQLAKLAGVSKEGVRKWERQSAMVKFRKATKAAVFSLRSIGAREAKQRLEAMVEKPVKKAKVARKAKKPAVRRRKM